MLLEGVVDRINLKRCIAQLPVGYRSIFVLHDIQGYQHNEIAEILGRSVGDSKSQLHKARMRLRELLHERQRDKAVKLSLAGFSNTEIADLLDTGATVIASTLSQARRGTRATQRRNR